MFELCANPPDHFADQSDRVVSLPLGLMDYEATFVIFSADDETEILEL